MKNILELNMKKRIKDDIKEFRLMGSDFGKITQGEMAFLKRRCLKSLYEQGEQRKHEVHLCISP